MASIVDTTAFRGSLLRDGYAPAERSLPAGPPGTSHTHDFHARGLILEGSFTITAAGSATTFRPGEIFSMGAGCEHSEQVGPEGVRYIVGRKPA